MWNKIRILQVESRLLLCFLFPKSSNYSIISIPKIARSFSNTWTFTEAINQWRVLLHVLHVQCDLWWFTLFRTIKGRLNHCHHRLHFKGIEGHNGFLRKRVASAWRHCHCSMTLLGVPNALPFRVGAIIEILCGANILPRFITSIQMHLKWCNVISIAITEGKPSGKT